MSTYNISFYGEERKKYYVDIPSYMELCTLMLSMLSFFLIFSQKIN